MRIIGNDPSIPRQAQIVASGTLSTGDTVVVNSDGTVSVVAETDVSQAVGTEAVFESGTSNHISSTFDSNSNKVVIAYEDDSNSGYGTAVVGTVSGQSISFGTPVVFDSSDSSYTAATFDSSNNKVVIAWTSQANSNKVTAVVATVSGTSISFGTSVAVSSDFAINATLAYDAAAEKVVLSFREVTLARGRSRVGTVSGTSISFGSSTDFLSGSVAFVRSVYDANAQKVVVIFRDSTISDDPGTAIVGTVSGTSISFGTSAAFSGTNRAGLMDVAYDSVSQKVLVIYQDSGNSDYGTAIVGTVSGTSISFGTAVVFNSAETSNLAVAYDANAQKMVMGYRDGDNSGKAIVGTVSGTSISFGTEVALDSLNANYFASTYDSSAEKVIISYRDGSNSSYGTSVVFQAGYTSTNLTAENYIGTAATGAPDGTGAKINLKGAVDENQSGLTAGQSYYVQTDGTLGTTPADPSVFAGTAVAANKLIVKG